MCFEFEWLYWAQLAQEKARNDEESRDNARVESRRPRDTRRETGEDDRRGSREPAHA